MYYPENSHYEYLLLLNIPDVVEEKINRIKDIFYDKYKNKNALNKPHITLNTFVQYATCEMRLIDRLHYVAKTYDPFNININGFSSFPTHTIYVNVSSRLPVLELVRNLRINTQHYMKAEKIFKPFFTNLPHVTISKGLTNEQYENAWKWLQHQHFSASFISAEMRLLKRKPKEKYSLVERFFFEKKIIQPIQGLLF